jgi:phage terminase large subunit
MTQAVYEYEARGGAARLFDTRAREVLIEGPARTGKSRGMLEKAYAVACRYPKARVLLVRKTRASMSESVLQTLEDHVFPPNASWIGTAKRTHRDLYRLPNGSMIVPGGMDHTDKIMSTEWDRVFAFEWTEASETDHEKLLTRLSGNSTPFRQMAADCNPQAPSHWLNQRFLKSSDNRERILSRLEDNPIMHDGGGWTPLGVEYRQTLDALTGVRRARLKDGRWAQADGVVFPEFDASVNVIDRMPEGWEKWRKYRAIDFGWNDPFVCLWIADSGEALYVYREWYMSERLVEDHAKVIVELSRNESYVATVADHDREDRETLKRHGVSTQPADKAITRGLDVVRSRLAQKPNGRRGFYYLASALVEYDRKLEEKKRPTSLRDEFDSYVWAAKSGGLAKELPVDADNHGMDALRYAAMACGRGHVGPVAMVVSQWE